MSTENAVPDVNQTLRAIQEQLAALTERLRELEARSATPGRGPAVSAPAAPAVDEATVASLDEHTVLVISAAIAAFLGKKASIRQIKLISSPSWARQGRLAIHTSHALTRTGFTRSGAAS